MFNNAHRLISTLSLLLLSACASLPDNSHRVESRAYTGTGDTELGREFADERQQHPGQSGFLLLDSGLDAFVGRVALARHAERSIDVQYYLYHADLVGRLFTNELLEAADRGVRVRMLIDDMALGGSDGDLGAVLLDSHPNIELRIINPFSRHQWRLLQFLTRFGTVTRRMHNKSFTVDNQATILGGRNIGNEYFEADPALAFSDLDVLAIGPVVDDASRVFDLYWNSALSYPVGTLAGGSPGDVVDDQRRRDLQAFVAAQQDSAYLAALRESTLMRAIENDQLQFDWGPADLVYDRPEKLSDDRQADPGGVMARVGSHVDDIDDELIIFSPYFVPGPEGTKGLLALVERGVRVRILTNSLASSDVGAVHAGYSRYRKKLLRGGVELYEMDAKLTREQRKQKRGLEGSSKASLHAKSFILDRKEVFIGSLNVDPRSVVENTEVGVLLESPPLANEMAQWFDDNIEQLAFRVELVENASGAETLRWTSHRDGEERVFDADPYTSIWQRMGIALLGLLPIESQL